ncbi:uncharacterized protein B0I36DRAFT_342863 [Microdochium trichocladiopsis]|uniref:Uncharacterized protein n=1 Tax=Microdochium trichocladiopsis TaxID=1682393 RepID=A0A9P9BHP1_9PEZI|nr:uncharacterized protein B0I36DRAFT_342863 [Microdochium trichocladiopsis]KAH7009065.1 hypothetical protein B0I36DRAFT_342863 [Microdochium trichocladiopsis]
MWPGISTARQITCNSISPSHRLIYRRKLVGLAIVSLVNSPHVLPQTICEEIKAITTTTGGSRRILRYLQPFNLLYIFAAGSTLTTGAAIDSYKQSGSEALFFSVFAVLLGYFTVKMALLLYEEIEPSSGIDEDGENNTSSNADPYPV